MNINIISHRYGKKLKFKNKNYESFINNQFETVIFSNCLEFLNENFLELGILLSIKYLKIFRHKKSKKYYF